MSFKGFQKSIIRAPQTLKSRLNFGENTKDLVYIDAERRFQELETETKKLHDESKKYFEAISEMMMHQIEFSQAIAEIYKPISGRLSDPDSLVQEGNPQGIQACEEYEAIVKDLLLSLQPELEMIETRVIRPANELLDIVKVIRKSVLKRHHKQLDYDRYRATLKKLQDKKDKTLKDEKALYKAENDVEQASQEFNYYNDLLKEELPTLFGLERELIKPLFQSFYYMQLNVFYTLHEKMQRCDIGYFNLQSEIEEGFRIKQGDVRERAESLSITKFKSAGFKRPPRPTPAIGAPASRLAIEESKPTPKPTTRPEIKPLAIKAPPIHTAMDSSVTPPPPYTSLSPHSRRDPNTGSAQHTNSAWGAVAKAKGAPPPPKPKPARFSVSSPTETVTALYDYEAQAESDISFKAGDIIDILSRTSNENEWWTGRIRGKQGQFPGNLQYYILGHK
ncbi:BAR domain-containing protein/SH3 domain signaling protein [Blumeria hordei DH14]|uniref:BAR domain-containing protein/SH3 domain signaling protein n=1 Tax=Blumeria graminis f. sp. hordei (strain DH14) TaxID=546991 RepID=N1JJM2_BLUG1|nr:BAR domain-containing protein/SH3 domain signaling protein [Blumeria hordei DH14]